MTYFTKQNSSQKKLYTNGIQIGHKEIENNHKYTNSVFLNPFNDSDYEFYVYVRRRKKVFPPFGH